MKKVLIVLALMTFHQGIHAQEQTAPNDPILTGGQELHDQVVVAKQEVRKASSLAGSAYLIAAAGALIALDDLWEDDEMSAIGGVGLVAGYVGLGVTAWQTVLAVKHTGELFTLRRKRNQYFKEHGLKFDRMGQVYYAH